MQQMNRYSKKKFILLISTISGILEAFWKLHLLTQDKVLHSYKCLNQTVFLKQFPDNPAV